MATSVPSSPANPLGEVHVLILFALSTLARDLGTVCNDLCVNNDEPDEMELTSITLSGVNTLAALVIAIRRAQEWARLADLRVASTVENPRSSWLYQGTLYDKEFAKNEPGICTLNQLVIVDSFSLLAGTGSLYEGDDLKTGSKKLAALDDQLALAIPDKNRWSGDSADAYADEVNRLRDFVMYISEHDDTLSDAAQNHAQVVSCTRLALEALECLLLAA